MQNTIVVIASPAVKAMRRTVGWFNVDEQTKNTKSVVARNSAKNPFHSLGDFRSSGDMVCSEQWPEPQKLFLL